MVTFIVGQVNMENGISFQLPQYYPKDNRKIWGAKVATSFFRWSGHTLACAHKTHTDRDTITMWGWWIRSIVAGVGWETHNRHTKYTPIAHNLTLSLILRPPLPPSCHFCQPCHWRPLPPCLFCHWLLLHLVDRFQRPSSLQTAEHTRSNDKKNRKINPCSSPLSSLQYFPTDSVHLHKTGWQKKCVCGVEHAMIVERYCCRISVSGSFAAVLLNDSNWKKMRY